MKSIFGILRRVSRRAEADPVAAVVAVLDGRGLDGRAARDVLDRAAEEFDARARMADALALALETEARQGAANGELRQ